MSIITTRVRAGLATTVLAGTAVLVAAPAYAAVAPEEPTFKAQQPSQSVIDHYSVTVQDARSSSSANGLQTKAAIEHEERVAQGSTPGLTTQTKAQIEQLERAAREQESSSTGTSGGSSSDNDVPVTVLVLASGAAVLGAAGLTVYRIRHNGPMSPATA